MTDGPAVETVDLAKQYGRVRALDGLTMTIERGEVFGLLGPNGAGKTTVVKLLLGLARSSGGGGRVLGAPLGDCRRGDGSATSRAVPLSAVDAGPEVLALHCDLARLPRADWPPRSTAASASSASPTAPTTSSELLEGHAAAPRAGRRAPGRPGPRDPR